LYREYGRRLEAKKELVSQPASPTTDLTKVSTLFNTVEGPADTGKYRSSSNNANNNKFQLDAAFIRRVMGFERCSPLLSSHSSDTSREKSPCEAPLTGISKKVAEDSKFVAKGAEESTTEKSGSTLQDVDKRRQRRRTREGRNHLKATRRYWYTI
jgi:hypothetical protein